MDSTARYNTIHSTINCIALYYKGGAQLYELHYAALHSRILQNTLYCIAQLCGLHSTIHCTTLHSRILQRTLHEGLHVLNQNTLHTVLNTGSCFTKMSDSTFDSSQKTRKPRWTSCRCTKKAEHRCKMHVPWCTYMVHHCVPWCTLHMLKAQKSWAVCIAQQG